MSLIDVAENEDNQQRGYVDGHLRLQMRVNVHLRKQMHLAWSSPLLAESGAQNLPNSPLIQFRFPPGSGHRLGGGAKGSERPV